MFLHTFVLIILVDSKQAGSILFIPMSYFVWTVNNKFAEIEL